MHVRRQATPARLASVVVQCAQHSVTVICHSQALQPPSEVFLYILPLRSTSRANPKTSSLHTCVQVRLCVRSVSKQLLHMAEAAQAPVADVAGTHHNKCQVDGNWHRRIWKITALETDTRGRSQ